MLSKVSVATMEGHKNTTGESGRISFDTDTHCPNALADYHWHKGCEVHVSIRD